MFLLQPTSPDALDNAYDNLHGLCSGMKVLKNGQIIVLTTKIDRITSYYGDQYTVID